MLVDHRKGLAGQNDGLERLRGSAFLGRFIRTMRSVLGWRQIAPAIRTGGATASTTVMPVPPAPAAIPSPTATSAKIARPAFARRGPAHIIPAPLVGHVAWSVLRRAARSDGFTGQWCNHRRRGGLLQFSARWGDRLGSVVIHALIRFFDFLQEITDVEESVAIQPDVNKGRLHARKHASNSSFVNAAD